jgi:hypothetical protein
VTRRYTGLRLTPEQQKALDGIRPHVDQLHAEFGDTWEVGPCHPWNGTVERLYAKRHEVVEGEVSALSARTVDELRAKLRDRS